MELSNGMRKFFSIIVIIFLFAIIFVGIFFLKNLFTNTFSEDPCINSSPGMFDACCVTEGRGNKFDTGINKCVTIDPPIGNPTQLPLIQVTDSNNNIIRPPTGQESIIKPLNDEN